MSLIVTQSIGGQDVVLLLAQHNWKTAPDLDVSYPSVSLEARSGEEERFPEADGIRLSVHLEYFLQGADLQEWREFMVGNKGELVAVPLYSEQHPAVIYETAVRVEPSFSINFDAERNFAIHAGKSIPQPAAYRRAAPLHFGRVSEWSAVEGVDGDKAYVKVSIDSDAPPVYRIDALDTDLPASLPAGMQIDFVRPTESLETGLERQAMGQGRELAHSEKGRENNLLRDFSLRLSGASIGTAISFFASRKGVQESFSAPAAIAPDVPSAAAPHGTVCRFASSRIRLSFRSRDEATAKVQLRHLPWEINPDRGYAMGRRVRLFRVTYRLPSPQYTYLTNCDSPVTAGGQVYQPGKIKGSRLKQTMQGFASESFELSTHAESGNPFMALLPGPAEAEFDLDMWVCDPANPDATLQHRFSGQSKGSGIDGSMITVKFVAGGGDLANMVGEYAYKPDCNLTLYQCGVDRVDFETAGVVSTVSDNVVEVTGAAAKAASYFQRGGIELGAGAAFQRRSIVGSTPIVGGQSLTLDRAFTGSVVASACVFYPGCDHERGTCFTRFDNYANFKGHPHMPLDNISIKTFDKEFSGAKK